MNTYNFHKTTANYDPVFKNEALMNTLTLNERVVYGMFHGWMATSAMNGGEDFFLSADSIVAETGLSPATVKRIIAKMKELGYITQTKKGYSGKASRYVVKHVDQIEAEYQAAKESTTTAPEAPVSVSVEQPVPQQPVVEEVAQKAVESVTEVIPATEGVKHLARRNVPVQVVEQPVVVKQEVCTDNVNDDAQYVEAVRKHYYSAKGSYCNPAVIQSKLSAVDGSFIRTYGPNSPFRITYLQGKAA